MDNTTFEKLKPALISLGFSYAGVPSKNSPDPEKTLVATLSLFHEDQKLYRMLLAWMERFGDLVHVERMATYLADLSPNERFILGVTALKLFNTGDTRFKSLFERIRKEKPKYDLPLSGQDEYLIEKNGLDPEFKFFGIKTAKITPADSKKLHSRKFVLESNLWLRFRALLGTNYRADIAFVRTSRLVDTAYGAMKFLHCSKETSYRIWGSLEEARVEDFIRVPSAQP